MKPRCGGARFTLKVVFCGIGVIGLGACKDGLRLGFPEHVQPGSSVANRPAVQVPGTPAPSPSPGLQPRMEDEDSGTNERAPQTRRRPRRGGAVDPGGSVEFGPRALPGAHPGLDDPVPLPRDPRWENRPNPPPAGPDPYPPGRGVPPADPTPVQGPAPAPIDDPRGAQLSNAPLPPRAAGPPLGYRDQGASEVAQRVLAATDAYRIENGLAPLTPEPRLNEAAQRYAERMARENFFDHTAPDGSEPGARLLSAGYSWKTWGENLAAGYQTPEEAVRAWIESPHHRVNLLNPGFNEIGLGFSRTRDPLSGQAGPAGYWVQEFGARWDR